MLKIMSSIFNTQKLYPRNDEKYTSSYGTKVKKNAGECFGKHLLHTSPANLLSDNIDTSSIFLSE